MRLLLRAVSFSLILLPVVHAAGQASTSTHRKPVLPIQFGPVVKDAPVTAIRVLDCTPAAGANANAIHGEEKFARDSAGRTRSEVRYDGNPATITILDHVAHAEWTWREGDTVARKLPLKEYPVAETRLVTYPDTAPKFDGVPTSYTRTASRANPDEMIESWYSAELHMAMATIMDAPDWGKTSYRYTHIQRGEPDAALFHVPDGMKEEQLGTPPPPPVLLAERKTDVPADSSVSIMSTTQSSSTTGQPAYASDPKFQKALDEARHGGPATTDEIAGRWKRALKLSNGACVECLKRLIPLQESMGAYKDEQKTAEQLDVVATAPVDKLFARVKVGQTLMQSNFGEPKKPELEQAEKQFRAALQIGPNDRTTLYEEGRVLAMLGRDDEAKIIFQTYVRVSNESDRYYLRATRFAANPYLAALKFAPPFKLVTAQGEELQLDDMHGKVVLLDFWATWCGPCKESLPEIQRIAKDFKDDPLVVISISSDQDSVAWKKFMQDHNMDWPQYRDSNGALSRAYGVQAIPHYFTIDANGVLQTEMIGSGADVRGKLKKLVKQAKELQQTQVAEVR